MKILYDHQIFSLQRYGGISRCFFELMNAYSKDSNVFYELGLKYSENAYLKSSKEFSHIKRMESTKDFFKNFDFKGSKYLHRMLTEIGLANEGNFVNKKTSVQAIKEGDFDVFHPTYYDDYFLKHLDEKPFVLTVHDMIYEIYQGEYFNKSDFVIKRKKNLVKKASRIIAVSENTKTDIINFYGINEDKIDVVYHGSSLKYTKLNKDYNFPSKYILFIGDRHFYKNFVFFLNSLSPLLKKDSELFILCVGSKPFNEQEVDLITKLGISNKVIHKPIEDDNMLAHSYKNALCFVFPTLYEGFGIPILEAFSCECPAVLSNSSCLPEVAGDAALFFEPTEQKSLRNCVKDLIYSNEMQKEFKKKGKERLKNFSLEKTALGTKNIYDKVLNEC